MNRLLSTSAFVTAMLGLACGDSSPSAAVGTDTDAATDTGGPVDDTGPASDSGVATSTGVATEADSSTTDPASTDGETETDGGTAVVHSLSLMRRVSWPGGGRELTVKLVDAEGLPVDTDFSEDFAVDLPLRSSVQARKTSLSPGFTAIVVAIPDDAEALSQLVDDTKQFIAARPAEESIALFVWRDSVEQLAGFGQTRTRLGEQLDRLASFAPAAAMATAEEVAIAIEEEAMDIGGRAPRGMRAAVVVGADERMIPPAESAIPIVVGLDSAAETIDTLAADAFYTVAICAEPVSIGGILSIDSADTTATLPISLPSSLAEEADSPCDLAAISAGDRTYPQVLEMVFDKDQQAIYDEIDANNSEADFELSVRIGDQGLAPATAHLRGYSSLGCARHSYTLQLDGAGRHFMPDSRTDEFYLISMCRDDRYIQAHTANQLMAELGVFALKFRYVEVRLGDETNGVYLMLEKMREELVRDHSRVDGVLRRRGSSTFEVKYGSETDPFYSLYENASEDLGVVDEVIDLDQYLRFLALMTAYRNGDHIDEIFMTAVEQASPDGPPTSWFTMSGWDNDDLFSDCHFGGVNAFDDRNGLIYCAESSLDHMLMSDPVMYDRYVDTLETLLLDEVPPARFDEALDVTEAALLPFLADPAIAEAMIEIQWDNPGASDPAIAQQDVQEHLDEMSALYAARHQLLLDRIAIYRGR